MSGLTAMEQFAWCVRCKDLILGFHRNCDQFFYRVGLSIGTKPWLWLLISFLVNLICSPGLLLWREEDDDVELCIPLNSVVRQDALWIREHFHNDLRYESIIITAPNVLDIEVLRSINDIETTVKNLVVNNSTWRDVCAGILTWFEDEHAATEEYLEFLPNGVMDTLNKTVSKDGCIYQSLLKLWQGEDFNDITAERVLLDVNGVLKNGSKSHVLYDIAPLLSEVKYDENGRVKSAKATILNWMLKESNPDSAEWELEFIKHILRSNRTLPPGMEVFAVTARSFKDLLHETTMGNMPLSFVGIFLITIYVIVMIGRCNAVQQRIYLSLLGVSVIGQAMISSYGVCYYLGFVYGPLHPALPFLILGIGVDDMFVIMQSLENLSKNEKMLEIPLRIAKVVQHSGMSITVTSFTNLVAFGIGMTTVMPFLRSFCMFALMGILFLYIFELTFFVSCLVIDERRVESKKEGCCCQSRPSWEPNQCDQKNLQQITFEEYVGPFITKTSIKIVVIFMTICLLCVNVWAIFQLDPNFDPLRYLDRESHSIRFNEQLQKYFPMYGKRAGIYMTGVDYYEDRDSLFQLVDTLKSNPYINNRTLEPWFVAYEKWLDRTNESRKIENRDDYYGTLTEYLFLNTEGHAYIKDIKFDHFSFGDYNITTTQIPIQHVPINTTSDQIQAMQSIRESVKAINFSQGHEHIAIFSPDYVTWSSNKIVGDELIRNLSLEILAIALVTIFFLRNVFTSLWVICCVIFTLIDLFGSMYFLGLSIEILSSVVILLCAGLSVDYALHIGLEFTRRRGSKNERAVTTLSVIGPPVFNGGLSTFLAVVLLAFCNTYLFVAFFKLFASVVVFGLFHGLLFLPVILSLLGPNDKENSKTVTTNIKKESSIQDRNNYYTVCLPKKEKDAGGGQEL